MEDSHTSPEATADQRRDRGAVVVEYIGMAAVMTVAIVAIGLALQALGLDLVDYVRTQIGV